MTVLTENSTETAASSAPAGRTAPSGLREYFSSLAGAPPVPWDATTVGGLISLVFLWAAWFYGTWATWGYLTADCGREMYVPLVLSEGKTLYKDIWYLYGPAAPYFNSVLYRLFGVHLTVLYWAGSLAALGSAIFLYLAGVRLSSRLVGWTAGAVLLTQSFHHSLFSFPLPYSFASVYGCFTACVFLWLLIRAATSNRTVWVFAAGTAAAVAFLLKLEIGAACYAGLALLIAVRWLRERSWSGAAKDIAVCLPGVAFCGAVLLWMISLGGVEFLTQENIMSWPTSFFMRTYGKFWLATTGLSLSAEAFGKAAVRTVIFFGVFQGFHLLVSWQRTARRLLVLRLAFFLGALAYLGVYLMSFDALKYGPLSLSLQDAMRYLFFPQDMVLYIAIIALFACWHLWKNPTDRQSAAVALTLAFSAMLAARILLMTTPMAYPIFYDGPAVLCFLLLARQVIQQAAGSRPSAAIAQVAICALCLMAAYANIHRQLETPFRPTAWLSTERGSIRVSEHLAEQYAAAIRFMKDQNALGNQVLSVPEDTSLYFFSETHCPTRVFTFTPGVLAPGKMTDELIREIEAKPVRYLLWSNRTFPEYKAMRFGFDFDQTLNQYFISHYHRVRLLVANPVPFGEWNAYIWERNSEAKPQ
ncbi:MAG TPA: glycosyltransferase family 39 protein [Candidatus Angelobacter sp.]|nr:glycosyltransferase family 39 protein [Candidatus Angelobacter sp.]